MEAHSFTADIEAYGDQATAFFLPASRDLSLYAESNTPISS